MNKPNPSVNTAIPVQMGSQKWPVGEGKREIQYGTEYLSLTSVFYDEPCGNPCKTLNDSDGKNQNSRHQDRCSLNSLEEKRKEIEGGDIDLNDSTHLINCWHHETIDPKNSQNHGKSKPTMMPHLNDAWKDALALWETGRISLH